MTISSQLEWLKTVIKRVYHTSEDNRKHYLKDFQSDVVVNYSDDKLKERPFNYEIFRSQVPFKGVEIRTSESKLEDTCLWIYHT